MRVLVRVRGTAPAGESVLVTEGARGEHVTLVQDASPSSSRSRTYAFDQVLSAEADQNMVYTEAIGSVLDDVLLGYHCTIFAYGQTGTGKTHTMEGDLSSFMETYAPDAGVIPRALYRLFHVLESRGSDFAEGERIAAGRRLGPADIALLAAMNVPRVTVARAPTVAVLAGGDELVRPGETPGPGQIISSNDIAVAALARANSSCPCSALPVSAPSSHGANTNASVAGHQPRAGRRNATSR